MGREEKIKDLCRNWILQATKNGSIQIGQQTEQYRLINNGIQFHELNFDELVAAGVGLAKILLLKGMNTIIDFDHLFFWSWSAEIILDRQDGFFTDDEHDLRVLFEILIRSSLAGIRAPTNDPRYIALQKKADDFMEFNARELINHRTEIITYLSFPLLEGLCKKLCSEYVSFSGKVVKEFKVSYGNKNKVFKIDQNCNSLGALLYLLKNVVADSDLKSTMADLLKYVEKFGDGDSGYQVIYNWRNSSLHGEASYPTIGGTLVTISILICLHQLRHTYEKKQARIVKRLQDNYNFSRMSGHRSPWEFYPPY